MTSEHLSFTELSEAIESSTSIYEVQKIWNTLVIPNKFLYSLLELHSLMDSINSMGCVFQALNIYQATGFPVVITNNK